jgi:cellulose synthase/poly-beta-1,6-N-acetylglucosamine synthase-like glycosyltransferase
MILAFWLSIALIAYVYVGYPAVLRLVLWIADLGLRIGLRIGLRKGSANPQSNPQSQIRDPQYGVSIVIAARNEGARLASRIDNLLSLDYPAAKREIVVVSDGSTDDTLDVLARYRRFVDVVAVPPGGKALALNAGVAAARSEIVVFADARQVFSPDALRELVAPFADPRVGAVTGELRLDAESPCRRSDRDRRNFDRRAGGREDSFDRRADQRRRTLRSTIADGLGLYWKYEKQMRKLESRVWSTLGATGAIYAVRRALYRPLPADTILDDVLTPMRVVLAGYRVVFNEKARAFDRAAVDADAEARRKVRTLAGNYQILALEPALLLPWRNPVWLQYVSHKLGRLAVPYALLALFVATTVLAGPSTRLGMGSVFFAIALAGQVLFYLLAGAGAVLEFLARRRESPPAPAPARARQAVREIA